MYNVLQTIKHKIVLIQSLTRFINTNYKICLKKLPVERFAFSLLH